MNHKIQVLIITCSKGGGDERDYTGNSSIVCDFGRYGRGFTRKRLRTWVGLKSSGVLDMTRTLVEKALIKQKWYARKRRRHTMPIRMTTKQIKDAEEGRK